MSEEYVIVYNFDNVKTWFSSSIDCSLSLTFASLDCNSRRIDSMHECMTSTLLYTQRL